MGYSINLAKRIENVSREGDRFLICLSDAAFKLINLRMRNLFFGKRKLIQVKGILGSVGVYELHDSFVNPVPRLEPELARGFHDQMHAAFRNNSRDLWIHSCLQVSEEATLGCVNDASFRLCQEVLAVDQENPVGLYYLAQGYRERDAMDKALLLLADLVQFWPYFGDGWLEFGRVSLKMELREQAQTAFTKATLHGVGDDEVTAVYFESESATGGKGEIPATPDSESRIIDPP